jgi:hypothetical protein
MQRRNLRNLVAAATVASASILVSSQLARAVPVNALFTDDPRCDVVPNQSPTHELGDLATFPLNEAIRMTPQHVNFTVCVPDDGLANDYVVDMVNLSGQTWKNLFFVCDHNVTVGNADGSVQDLTGAPGILTDAFKIDGTVTPGVNINLLSESITADEIFQPGEIWRFAVSNYMAVDSTGAFQQPLAITPGIFAGSTNFPQTAGNCSILASPVPEPTTISLVAIGASALLLRRRRRAH